MPAAAFLGYPNRGFPAQLVNFAVQGIARLIEDPEERESKRYRLELLDRDKAVEKDDDIALRKLFGKDSGGGTTLVLDKQNRKLGDRIASLRRAERDCPEAARPGREGQEPDHEGPALDRRSPASSAAGSSSSGRATPASPAAC